MGCTMSMQMQKDDLGLWNKTTVGRILKNEMYLGTMVQGKRYKPSWKSDQMRERPACDWIRVVHTHEAIIDEETFRAVQERLLACRRSGGYGEKHSFSGKVRWLDCGSVMSRTSNASGGSQRTYLRCSRSKEKKTQALCTRHSIRLDHLAAAVCERIAAFSASCGIDLTGCSCAELSSDSRLLELDELEKVQKQIKQRNAALHALYLDLASGAVGGATYAEIKNMCCKELKHLNQRECFLRRNMAAEQPINRDLTTGSSLPEPSALLTPYLAGLFIKTIEVGEKNPETSEQRIRITWNF